MSENKKISIQKIEKSNDGGANKGQKPSQPSSTPKISPPPPPPGSDK